MDKMNHNGYAPEDYSIEFYRIVLITIVLSTVISLLIDINFNIFIFFNNFITLGPFWIAFRIHKIAFENKVVCNRYSNLIYLSSFVIMFLPLIYIGDIIPYIKTHIAKTILDFGIPIFTNYIKLTFYLTSLYILIWKKFGGRIKRAFIFFIHINDNLNSMKSFLFFASGFMDFNIFSFSAILYMIHCYNYGLMDYDVLILLFLCYQYLNAFWLARIKWIERKFKRRE